MIASSLDIWRQRAWVWGVALGFVILNCVGLAVYKIGYSDRVRTLRTELRDEAKNLADARDKQKQMNALLAQAKFNREGILQLYSEHFSTRRRRLTGITAEVQSLASRAGLVPRAFSYPEQQIQQYGLIKRSFVFSVEGTYADLRKFINLLEVSDSFLTLEAIGLNEQEASTRRLAGGRPGSFAAPGAASFGVPGAGVGARPGVLPAPGVAAPQIAGAPVSEAGQPLHMSLTISTLFAAQDETSDALAPLPGSNFVPHARPR